MANDLVSYAMDFVSFLIREIKEIDNIRNIILFGSAARGEADKESDIDIFVDLIKYSRKEEEKIKKIQDKFMGSAKYKNYWKLLGIENSINLMIGKLDEWKELKPSIVSNGITLYGKFKAEIKGGKHTAFFIWENINPNAKRVLFNKQMFGYRQRGRYYKGLIEKYGGQRLGKGCISMSLENFSVFHKIFKKYRISVKIKKVVEY